MPVVVNGARIGSVEIVPEPRDEIAEVWGNTVALGTVALIVNVAVIGMLYLLFGRVLDPLTGVSRGLADLERRNYQVRLPRPRAHELAAITDRFNALAQALDAARTENERLTHRLITAQDDERRSTALELHDEVGPSLFGLKANASSIATAARELPSESARKLAERARHAGDRRAPAEHQPQHAQPAAADGARPRASPGYPFRAGARARAPTRRSIPAFRRQAAAQLRRSVDLTVYRCVQESLTNAIRHAQASKVAVEIAEADNRARTSGRRRGRTHAHHPRRRPWDRSHGPARLRHPWHARAQALSAAAIRWRARADRGTCVRIAIPLHDERP